MDDNNQNSSEPQTEGPVENAWSLKIPKFEKGHMKHPLTEESSFLVLFPRYREQYLKESWPVVKKLFKDYGIKAELDLAQSSMFVVTTRKTWDPYMIIKARDFIRLLSRSVPVEQARKVLEDNTTYEIVKIRGMVRNKERFVKRRNRLIGPGKNNLKALELLTDCYVCVQGATVAIVGPHKGVKQATEVVKSTMNNIHPIYHLKALAIKRVLARDPEKKNCDWSKLIPKIPKRNVQTKSVKRKPKKEFVPFPPAQLPQKVDAQMESGEIAFKNARKKPKDHKKSKKPQTTNTS